MVLTEDSFDRLSEKDYEMVCEGSKGATPHTQAKETAKEDGGSSPSPATTQGDWCREGKFIKEGWLLVTSLVQGRDVVTLCGQGNEQSVVRKWLGRLNTVLLGGQQGMATRWEHPSSGVPYKYAQASGHKIPSCDVMREE